MQSRTRVNTPPKKATTKNIIYICLHKYQMKPLLLLFIQQIGHLRSRENTFRGAYLSWRRVAFVASLFVIIMRTFFAATTTITMQTWRRIRVKLIFTHTYIQYIYRDSCTHIYFVDIAMRLFSFFAFCFCFFLFVSSYFGFNLNFSTSMHVANYVALEGDSNEQRESQSRELHFMMTWHCLKCR